MMNETVADQFSSHVILILGHLPQLSELDFDQTQYSQQADALLSEIQLAWNFCLGLRVRVETGQASINEETIKDIESELAVIHLLLTSMQERFPSNENLYQRHLLRLQDEGNQLKDLVRQLGLMSVPSVNDFVRSNIRRIRKSKGKSMRYVASRVGIPYSSYASLETGVYNIKLDHLFRILQVLKVEIDDVWPTSEEVEASGNSVAS